MIAAAFDTFAEIWAGDFEYQAADGEPPTVHCGVFREIRSGQTLRLWADELQAMDSPPFAIGPSSLFVSYYAPAELSCFHALGWPMPERVLDLWAEFKCLTNGVALACGRDLLGALAYHGLAAIDAAEKSEMRDLAIRGGPFTEAERLALTDYCESDVVALAKLLPAMADKIDLSRALLRGRYMAAVARMEAAGVPIDVESLAKLRANWARIESRLIAAVDADYGVFVPRGQRTVDPTTKIGTAIINTAAEYEIDADQLADAVDHVYLEDRAARAEHTAAIKAARRETKLTPARIKRWEETGGRDGRGGDYSTYPYWDEHARELAASYPALGVGRGYVGGEGFDNRDVAGEVWALLREDAAGVKPKDHPDILRKAAEMVAADAMAFDTATDTTTRPMRFSSARFAQYLERSGIPWPRLESGDLALDDDTFREMAKSYPAIAPLRELRHSLSELRLNSLTVGTGGRNRTMLRPFASKTGRNQPSNAKFIFGPSVWLRGLIQPPHGSAVAYLDWSQQEFGIVAALSGDRTMQEAYTSGDPYLTFAKQAGAVPEDGTKETHGREREQFKACVLAVQYGMGEKSLALRIGRSQAHARELLQLHRATYPKFWQWSQAAVDHAMLNGYLFTVFGWQIHVGGEVNPRSLANFPAQANGAEMLRLACCLATERGIRVCAPVHDALLIEADADEIEQAVDDCQAAMREASEIVLSGFALRSDAKIIRHPDRYADPRGVEMWDKVWAIVGDMEGREAAVEDFDPFGEPVAPRNTHLLRCATPTCCAAQHPSSFFLS